MNPIKVCLVYEEVPEQTTTFIVTCKTQESVEFLKKCHLRFVNNNENDETILLSQLVGEEQHWQEEYVDQLNFLKSQMAFEKTEEIVTQPDLVIISGFIL